MIEHKHWNLGIIGAGPRCLTLLQHLYMVARKNRCRLRVTVFDPTSELGAGRIYSTSQPDFFRCSRLKNDFDIFIPEFSRLFSNSALSFRQWAFTKNIAIDSTPPRAVMGRYLLHAAKTIVDAMRGTVSVEHAQALVSTVVETPMNLEVHTSKGTYALAGLAIANGHSGWDTWPSGSTGQHKAATLGADRINSAEQATVLVEGKGLALVETCLALANTSSAKGFKHLTWMNDCELLRGPKTIAVTSTSAQLCLPQAVPTVLQMVKIDKIIQQHKSEIERSFQRGHQPRRFFSQELLPRFYNCASAIASKICGDDLNCQQWLRVVWPAMNFDDCVKVGKQISANQYHDHGSASCAAALSLAFKALQGTINQHSDFGRFCAQDRADYKTFCNSLAPIAHGPAAKVMDAFYALLSSGLVVAASASKDRAAQPSVSEKIRAEIPGPHDNFGFGLYRSLLAQHSISRDRATGAVLINRDGFAIRQDGSSNLRLAIFARASEHWVSGMDSLEAINHPVMGRWAQRAYECRHNGQQAELELTSNAKSA